MPQIRPRLLLPIAAGLLFILISNILIVNKSNNPWKVGSPSIIGSSRFVEAPGYCDTIDYMHDGPVHRGWPFVTRETLHDECGAFFKEWYTKIYPVGIAVNSLLAILSGGLIAKLATLQSKKGENYNE